MKTGDIIVVSFPYADLTNYKVRPAVVVNITADHHKDVIACLISSVIPSSISDFDIIIQPDNYNNLRAVSIIKVSRIATIEQVRVRSIIGSLQEEQMNMFKSIFKSLVD